MQGASQTWMASSLVVRRSSPSLSTSSTRRSRLRRGVQKKKKISVYVDVRLHAKMQLSARTRQHDTGADRGKTSPRADTTSSGCACHSPRGQSRRTLDSAVAGAVRVSKTAHTLGARDGLSRSSACLLEPRLPATSPRCLTRSPRILAASWGPAHYGSRMTSHKYLIKSGLSAQRQVTPALISGILISPPSASGE